jgi:hypothetical protein
MKKIATFSVLFFTVFTFACAAGGRGEGPIIQTERALLPFSSISVNSIEVRLHTGPEYRAVLEVSPGLEEFIELSVTEGGVLRVDLQAGRSYVFINGRDTTTINAGRGSTQTNEVFAHPIVNIYVPSAVAINEITLNNSATLFVGGAFNAATFTLNVNGSSEARINSVALQEITVNITGSGSVDIRGEAQRMNLDIFGSGSFNGQRLRTQRATVLVAGSATANVWVEDELRASQLGIGRLRQRGNPNIIFL